jgi:hypothetical protein
LLDANGQALMVRATAQGNPEKGYAAKVSFSGPQGTDERYLEHPSCENLVQALALVVALAIDPERVHALQRTREPGSEAPAPPEPPASAPSALPERSAPRATPKPERTPVATPDTSSRSVLRGLRWALHGLAGAGSLPRLGAGLEATVGWHRQTFRAELVGRYWVPRQESLQDIPSLSIELGLDTVGARACWLPLSGPFQLAACAGGDLGAMSARGSASGLENPRVPHALYADLAAGLQLAYTRARLAPEGGFEVSGAATRPAFGIGENGQWREVFRPESWGFLVFLGLAFEL